MTPDCGARGSGDPPTKPGTSALLPGAPPAGPPPWWYGSWPGALLATVALLVFTLAAELVTQHYAAPDPSIPVGYGGAVAACNAASAVAVAAARASSSSVCKWLRRLAARMLESAPAVVVIATAAATLLACAAAWAIDGLMEALLAPRLRAQRGTGAAARSE